jgi:glucose-6-phosphate isomerase
VVLTYNWPLRSFANYAQQLEMESLGKPFNSKSIFHSTGQTIYGGFGSTAQHSYFQLLHQGTSNTAADIIFCSAENSLLLEAQALGQSELLSGIKQLSKNSLEKTNGNIPVNLFKLKSLSLKTLGFLISSWEHRVFLTSQMLEINPFDQYGVKAGKIAAKQKLKKL